MINRTIKVRVVKQTPRFVTIKLMSANSRMPLPKDEFHKRLNQGVYDVVNEEVLAKD